MPFIVGSPRSGTTLLRFMLDAHPDLAIPPETGFLRIGWQLTGSGDALRELFFQATISYPPEAPAWNDFQIPAEEFHSGLMKLIPFSVADGFRLFYRMYAERFGKRLWGDKTPTYLQDMKKIQYLLPEARFIHIIRDGRDVAASLRKQWFSPGNDIAIQARYWRDNVYTARAQGSKCLYYLEILYEDLLRQTAPVLQKICNFLELDFHEAMLRYYERTPERLQEHTTRCRIDGSTLVSHEDRFRQQAATTIPPDLGRIGVWKQALSNEECRQFETIAGAMLKELGY